MTIRPIDMSGMIQRTQDVGTIKQQEDEKPYIDQQNIQQDVKKEEQKLTKEVHHADDSNQPEYRYDAKEKGNNQYQQKKQKKKKQHEKVEDKVMEKHCTGSIDIKI